MFAMMEMTDAPPVGMVERIRRGFRGYRGVSADWENVLGMKVLRVAFEVPDGKKRTALEKRIGFTIGLLKQQGIKQLGFSAGFPYKEIFIRAGFTGLKRDALYELLMCDIAVKAAVERNAAALFARRITLCVERALRGLCANYRYVMVEIESGGDLVCRNLRRAYGVSVIEKPSHKQLMTVNTALFFNQPLKKISLPDECVTVAVNENMLEGVVCQNYVSAIDVEISPQEANPLPAGYSRETFLAAAVSAGVLRGNHLTLNSVKIETRGVAIAGKT